MATYILPFYEAQRGWFEIEADSIEEARKLAEDNDYMADIEQYYKDGQTEWDPAEITEATEVAWYKQSTEELNPDRQRRN